MKYRCYILDDEPLAIRVIENYLAKLNNFEVVGMSTDPVRGFEELQDRRVDLLFLDIEMPGLSGLDLLGALSFRPEVVVTTAYRDYAVEGFELDLLDYLVKPIPFPRFMKAIDRFIEKRSSVLAEVGKEYMFVRADRKDVKIQFNDVLYIQGLKDYVKIVTVDGNVLTKASVGNFAEDLPGDIFIRVHKSYVVNRSRVTAVTNHDVELGKVEVPIGRTYLDVVRGAFGV